jgi:diamine N-acetyltransferase
MVTLKGEHIYLRALEPEDLEFVHTIENDEDIWHLSNTQTPYSRFLIKQYIESAHKDIYEAKQLRLVISNYENEPLGMIDVFDFDFLNKRAGVGVLIKNKKDRSKGVGAEALQLLVKYCFTHLQLHQLFCNISEENKASLKKDWTFTNRKYNNEYLLQLINTNVL